MITTGVITVPMVNVIQSRMRRRRRRSADDATDR